MGERIDHVGDDEQRAIEIAPLGRHVRRDRELQGTAQSQL